MSYGPFEHFLKWGLPKTDRSDHSTMLISFFDQVELVDYTSIYTDPAKLLENVVVYLPPLCPIDQCTLFLPLSGP